MKTIVLIINLLWWINILAQAQCDKTLVQKATEQAGKDAVLVRDFKVRLKEGDKRNPSPSVRFTVLMQKDISYRFNIVGAIENHEAAVLQLYDKSNLLGSTFDFEKSINLSNFQYQCPRTGDYQVVIMFRSSKAGCAAGIMSMVVDSAFMLSRNQPEQTEDDVLYLGIDNHLQVSTDSAEKDKFVLSIDNGSVTNQGGNYIIRTERQGKARITVKRLGADGNVTEEVVKVFSVIPLPEPKVFLENAKDEYVNASNLATTSRILVIPSVYRILEFYISPSRLPISGLRSNDEYLTPEQRDFLKGLRSMEKFYIHGIKLEKPDGTIITLHPFEYYVR